MELRIAVLLAILFGVFIEARAADVMKDDKGNKITLHQGPCLSAAGALQTIPAPMRKQMKAARVFWQGTGYDACWIQVDPAKVFLVDESGDQGFLDRSRFVEEPGA